jgi:hypothetical protein
MTSSNEVSTKAESLYNLALDVIQEGNDLSDKILQNPGRFGLQEPIPQESEKRTDLVRERLDTLRTAFWEALREEN